MLLPEIVPLVAVHVIDVLLFQLPEMVYVYCVPGVTQVEPLIVGWLNAGRRQIKSIAMKNDSFRSIFLFICGPLCICH